jgi:para-nitrobenzyl esterase
MDSPLAKDLFQRAIGESGGAFPRSGRSFDPMSARAEKDAKLVKDKLGASTLAELRAIPAEKLLAPFVPPQSQGFDFEPDTDGYFLPESVPAIFAAARWQPLAPARGQNHDEQPPASPLFRRPGQKPEPRGISGTRR